MSAKKPLKIFVDAYLLNKEYQGIKTYTLELYKEFSRRNTHALIYLGCFESSEVLNEFKEHKNIQFLFYKSNSRIKRMLFEVPKLIKEHQFDFAHFHYTIPFSRNAGTQYIVTIHDILFNDFKDQFSWSYRIKRNFLFQYAAKNCDHLCTVSNYSKERIKKRYQIDGKKIHITPNGVSRIYFEDYDKSIAESSVHKKFGVKNFVLYISRIEPRKNQQFLVKYLSQLDPEVSLVFIGEKTLKNRALEKALSQLDDSTKKRIHFFRALSDKELRSFIQAAKIFVYPSLAEGFGIPPLEAGATKIPVLCSKLTAMEDFSFFAPYHIDFHQEEETLSLLKKMMNETHTNKLDEISHHIREQYSWSKASEVMEEIMEVS